jgi:hypothetical protein
LPVVENHPERDVLAPRKFISFQSVKVSAAEFHRNLDAKLMRQDYLSDLRTLVRADTRFDPLEAVELVRREVLTLLDET